MIHPFTVGFVVVKRFPMGCVSTADDLADAAFAGTAATLKGQTHTCVNIVYVPTKDRVSYKMYYSED